MTGDVVTIRATVQGLGFSSTQKLREREVERMTAREDRERSIEFKHQIKCARWLHLKRGTSRGVCLREFACLTAVILTPLRVEVALDGPSVTPNNLAS